MKLALFTPEARAGWVPVLVSALARQVELVVVSSPPGGASADLNLYCLADDPAFGFVYRALQRQPGLVILEDWSLHALVRAETVGLADGGAYRREARRAQGPRGEFVARQVLSGLGGALPSLVPLNERVLEASLAVVATSEAIRLAAARAPALRGRPVLLLPLASCGPDRAALALLRLAGELLPLLPGAVRAWAAARDEESTPLGRAKAELRPFARELGLVDLPAGMERPLVGLFPRPA